MAKDFMRAIFAGRFTRMSGPLGVILAVLALYVSNDAARMILVITSSVCICLTAYSVWKRERKEACRQRAEVRRQREEVSRLQTRLRSAQDDGRRRLALSELRTRGVALRNNGMDRTRDYREWDEERMSWMKNAISAISAIDSADAEWFRTMNVVPSPRLPAISPDTSHQKAYQEHEYLLVKLESLILRHSPLPRS